MNENATDLVLVVLAVIAVFWIIAEVGYYFSPGAKAERERINALVAEQHRLYDEEIERQERAVRGAEVEAAVKRGRKYGELP